MKTTRILLGACFSIGLAVAASNGNVGRADDKSGGDDAPRKEEAEDAGWSGERMPKGMRRGGEKGVYVWDTGKGLEIEMVYVPPGDFVMGSEDSDAQDFEKPRHMHPMPKGYYIGRYETTWREYRALIASPSAPPTPGHVELEAPSFGTKDDHPVVNVFWEKADAFCKWTGLELPTEAQWEKAARGTDGRTYSWGNDWDPKLANFADSSAPEEWSDRKLDWRDMSANDGHAYTAPVGSFPDGKSPCGAHDMTGNVMEWCADRYEVWGAYERYKNGDLSPPRGSSRVIRGGSWRLPATCCRASSRFGDDPGARDGDLGFRPVRSVD